MWKKLTPRQRINAKYFLSSSLLLGLPSLILTFLALRGILSDRALAEQEIFEQHQETVRAMVSTIESEILSLETKIRDVGMEISKGNLASARLLTEQLRASNAMVGALFVLRSVKQISYLGVPRLNVEDSSPFFSATYPYLPKYESDSSAFYEYQAQDYAKALSIYQRKLASARTREERACLLLAIARNQKYLLKGSDAAYTYGLLLEDYGQVRLALGMPVRFVARIELLKLKASQQGYAEAARGVLKLFDDLLRGRWVLSNNEFEFGASELIRFYQDLPLNALGDPGFFSSRFNQEQQEYERRKRTNDQILLFERIVASIVVDSCRTMGDENAFLRMSRTEENQTVSLLATCVARRQFEHPVVVGALLSGEDTMVSYVSYLVQRVALPPRSSLQVLDDRGRLVAGSAMPNGARQTVQATFLQGVPPWTITLYHQEAGVIDEVLHSRRSIYFLAFVLTFLVLASGSILLWRLVTREVELSRLQSEFVAVVSHELRSPLTSIRQLSEILQAGRLPSEERRQRYYDTLVEQSERLSQLVENILGFARLEQGKVGLNFEKLDLKELIVGMAPHLKNRFEHNGFSLVFQIEEGLPPLLLDRETIVEALTNIVDNAVKYSASSRKIDVLVQRRGENVGIAVRDYGLGIRKSDLKKIFGRFYRSDDPRVRALHGSGLGLSFTKSVVDRHNGKLLVESEYGVGSTFTIQLPVSQQLGKKNGEDPDR